MGNRIRELEADRKKGSTNPIVAGKSRCGRLRQQRRLPGDTTTTGEEESDTENMVSFVLFVFFVTFYNYALANRDS
jgi:hypothetical protein